MCAARHPNCLPEATAAGHALLEHLGRARRDPSPLTSKPCPQPERRHYQRLAIELPLRVVRVAGQQVTGAAARLVTRDVSSSGVRFAAPWPIEPDTPVELEIELLDGPLGGQRLQMLVDAHIVRATGGAQHNSRRGWREFAATFDEIRFRREEGVPAAALSDAAAD